MPLRLLLLGLMLLASAASAQTAVTSEAAAENRRSGLAALALGHDSVAAAHLGRAVRGDRRSAPTHLALALATAASDRRASRRATDRALRLDADLGGAWAARLRDLRRPPAASVLSTTDGRRTTAAQRLLALDTRSRLARLELAEREVASFRYERASALNRGVWRPTSWQGQRAWRAYAAAETHIDALLTLDARDDVAHRLAARLALTADSAAAFDTAARRALAARAWDGHAVLRAAAAAWRLGEATRADSLARLGLARLGNAAAHYTSPARFVRDGQRSAWEADSAGWAATFWRARDTRRLTTANERSLEHLARMVEADLLFAHPDGSAPGWATDRGDTWVRYGAPIGRRWWLEHVLGEYERWTYPDFALTFHDPWMSGRLEFQSSADGLDDVTVARGLANTVGETFETAVSELPLAAMPSAFRGSGGSTDVVVAYGLPLASVNEGAPGPRSMAWASDASGAVLGEVRAPDTPIRTAGLAPGPDGWVWTQSATLSLAPGAATLQAEAELSGQTGLHRIEIDVPEFSAPGLILSDLLLASAIGDIEDAAPDGAVRRGDTWMQPLPWPVLATDAALWVYVEIYGLTLDAGDSRFEIDAALTPVEPGGRLRRGLRRLLGRRPAPGVATGSEAGGRSPDDAQSLLLDVSGQAPGRYRLTLTVRDRVAGTSATQARDLLLESPRP